jgi:uncharacterized membrane protein
MRWIGAVLLYALSILVCATAWYLYTALPIGDAVPPALGRVFRENRVAVTLHVFCASVALLLGQLQFSHTLRRRAPRMHRWIGRVYLGVGVLIGGSAGLFLAPQSGGGPVARAGFLGIALVWLVTGAVAYRTIRRGDIAAHRRWMTRNFSVTLGAVTLRLYLGAGQLLHVPFETVYPIAAWLSWTLNLLVAEWWLRRAPTRRGVIVVDA